MAHSHGHTHGGRALAIAAALTGLFMLAEIAGGLISGSLALLADAGHMATDFASLLLAVIGVRMAGRPADPRRTWGWDRMTVLAAFTNGIALFAISLWIGIEAVRRLLSPAPVLDGVMLVVAVAGLAVNIAVYLVLHARGDGGLNTRAAMLHVLGDILGSVGAIAAALVIRYTGWTPADPILSLLVTVLILRAAWRVTAEAGRILLEAAPDGFDSRAAARRLEGLEGVADVHHLHAWSITEDRRAATLHVRLRDGADSESVRRRVRDAMASEFGIGHTTVETERGACLDRE